MVNWKIKVKVTTSFGSWLFLQLLYLLLRTSAVLIISLRQTEEKKDICYVTGLLLCKLHVLSSHALWFHLHLLLARINDEDDIHFKMISISVCFFILDDLLSQSVGITKRKKSWFGDWCCDLWDDEWKMECSKTDS